MANCSGDFATINATLKDLGSSDYCVVATRTSYSDASVATTEDNGSTNFIPLSLILLSFSADQYQYLCWRQRDKQAVVTQWYK